MFDYVDNLKSIDLKLSKAFVGITWIGELPLTELDFKLLAGSVRLCTRAEHVPPRVLIASMVFCARYIVFNEDENINFWNKYFQRVLKKEKTQGLENEYRNAFRCAREKLQAEYHFEFPKREQTPQEVVAGIYLHTILPAYLLDDFADFFLKHYPNQAAWQVVDRQFADEIAAQNEAAFFAPPILKRLIRFLQNKDTSMTAARLIKTLATAALWHSEGQDATEIAFVLAPIEQEIWKQMEPLLPAVGNLPEARPLSSRIRWAWLIEQNDILELHVKNLAIHSEYPPDRLVWLDSSQSSAVKVDSTVPDYGRNYCEVNAYHISTGYVIDSAILIDIEGEGIIVPVDRYDNALALPLPTGPSPSNEPAFFRIEPEEQLAILTHSERLTDGEYAISLPKAITLKAAAGGVIAEQYRLLVPKVLREQGHTQAARYTLSLPVLLGNKRIDKRRSRVAPRLEGSSKVAGLAFGALPIYEQGDIWLVVSPPTSVPLNRLSIRLIANDKVSLYRLSELEAAGQIMHEVDHQQEILRIRLNDYIPQICLLQVEVFSGVSRMHGDARLLGILPSNVRVTASSIENYYTPIRPPTVRIEGVSIDQVELASDARVDAQDGSVIVTWIDPRQDAALRLHFGSVILPITFDVKWSFAWATPLNEGYLLEDSLRQTLLSVRGKPGSIFYISVADGQPREDILNARGVENIAIEDHPLMEMLRNYHGERAVVKLWFADTDHRIDLFTFIRPQFSDFERQPQTVKDAVRAFKSVIQQGRRESGQPLPYSLAMLPNVYTDALPLDLLPPMLKTMRTIEPSVQREACEILPQRKQLLRLSDSCSYELRRQIGQLTITIDRPNSKGQTPLALPVEMRPDGVYINIGNTQLLQCVCCGELFWADDKNSKFKHAHGQFRFDTRNLKTMPIVAQVELMPWALDELRAFTPRFDVFIDRSLEHSLRIRQQGKARDLLARQDKSLFTQAAYKYATAAWVVKVGSRPNINSQFASLYKSHSFVNQICIQFLQQQIPALIIASRWIISECAARRLNDWQMLDPVVMMLAVIARAYAHGYWDLLTEAQLKHFSTCLQVAHECCPQLLMWALTWAELIFLYFNDKANS